MPNDDEIILDQMLNLRKVLHNLQNLEAIAKRQGEQAKILAPNPDAIYDQYEPQTPLALPMDYSADYQTSMRRRSK